jgi:hypothetical protein
MKRLLLACSALVLIINTNAQITFELFEVNGFKIPISSDERTSSDIATVLSNSINKPGTPWIEFKDEESLQGMLGAGLKPSISEAYVQMGKSIREGKLQEDYWKNKPVQMGKIKLEDFALEFKAAFEA